MKDTEPLSIQQRSKDRLRRSPYFDRLHCGVNRRQCGVRSLSHGLWSLQGQKPASPDERPAPLSARPQPAGERTGRPRIIRFGAFEADLEERELRKNGLRVKLHEKPFQVLELLATSQGETVTRKELCERLWPDTHVVFDRNLNAAVNKLRQTLRDSRAARGSSKHGPIGATDSLRLWKPVAWHRLTLRFEAP